LAGRGLQTCRWHGRARGAERLDRATVEFDPSSAVVPLRGADAWRGYLPADGSARLRWRERRESVEPTLAYDSSERSEVRLGDGLWRQVTTLDLRVMQGRMSRLRVHLEGAGDLVSVTGDASLTWTVRPRAGGERWLEVEWGRPVEETSPLVITSQAALGAFPALVEPLRLVPEGALRHSGTAAHWVPGGGAGGCHGVGGTHATRPGSVSRRNRGGRR
jgi:hypothetical protein